MAEIDPVVVKLIAEMGQYRAEMANTARRVDASLAQQERSVKRLENQLKASSSSMASTLRTLAGVFGTAFSAQQIGQLIDNFTRLQNSLRVSGLEGEGLVRVQAELLELSSRYGVSVNELANLYGKSSQAASDLGASSANLIQITEASAQALKITGTSATQAQGALLGLTQALSSGIVRAEEFNQINEGGLRPLLQAAANAERFGGSVARLRAAVIDGAFSSREFYAAILDGSEQLESQASKATLTLAGAFEALTSRLTVYVGESAQANGVTNALAGGIKLLADNLEVLITALATVGVALGTGFVVNAVRARVAALALGAASVGAAGAVGTLGFAAGRAGAALLTAFGGPVGVAILAIGAALAYAASQQTDFARASEAVQRSNAGVVGAAGAASSAIDRLASSYGRARQEALALVQAQRQIALATALRTGREQIAAEQEYTRQRNTARQSGGRYTGGVTGQAEANVRVARETARQASQTLADLDRALAAPAPTPAGSGPVAGGAGSGRSRGAGRQGPSAEDIQRRFANELVSLAQQTLQARSQLAMTAEEEAELARRSVELARRQALDGVANDENYSAAQKQRLRLQVEALADAELENIASAERLRLGEEAADLLQTQIDGQIDALRAQGELADNVFDRQRLALEIFDIEERQRQAALAVLVANTDLAQAVRDRAAAELAAAQASSGNRRTAIERSNESPLGRYGRARSSGAIREEMEQLVVDEIQNVRDGITDAITNQLGIKDPLIKGLLNILLEEVLLKPIAAALSQAQSSQGGTGNFLSTITTAFSSLFGRASGGYVAPGQMVRVNEGASPGRVEGFMPTGSGKVVPLGQMDAMRAGGGQNGGTVTVRLALSGDIDARIMEGAAGVAIQVVREAAGPISDLGAQKALSAAGRSRLPS